MPAPDKNQNAVKPADETATSFLYVRAVPAEKATWVRAAKRAGQKLAVWVKETLNRATK